MTTFDERRRLERLSRADLERYQLERLNAMLAEVIEHNAFYSRKLLGFRTPLDSLTKLADLPLTTKEELLGDSDDVSAANRTYSLDQYVRYHRTSGTHGRPLGILDTSRDWQWWVNTWQFVLDAAEVTRRDRVFMAFSFGPFIGFWSAHDAIVERGALAVPGGGMSTLARLELIKSINATVICCTPSYALHMAEVARKNSMNLREIGVRCIIVAGEPGGSMPAIQARVKDAWGSRLVDHAGATEVGPWGYSGENDGVAGLHIVETEFIAEFLDVPAIQKESVEGLAELVLTSLGRWGAPVIRYRTGDLVRRAPSATGFQPASAQPPRTNHFTFLPGGVLSRVDDMVIIRGVNVFPSAIESIIRSFAEVTEYRVTIAKEGEMSSLIIELEAGDDIADSIKRELEVRLGLNTDVKLVAAGTLPRFEGKGKRFVDLRP